MTSTLFDWSEREGIGWCALVRRNGSVEMVRVTTLVRISAVVLSIPSASRRDGGGHTPVIEFAEAAAE